MRGNLLTSIPSGGGFTTLRLNDNSKSPDKDGIITFTSLELRNSHEHDDRYYRHDISDGRYYTKTDASNTFAPKDHDHHRLYMESGNESNIAYGFNYSGQGILYINHKGASKRILTYIFRDGMSTDVGGLCAMFSGAPACPCSQLGWGW